MSIKFTRVSITLPKDQLRIIDQLRAERELTRSAFIQAVLRLHANDVAVERLDRYLRLVERIQWHKERNLEENRRDE